MYYLENILIFKFDNKVTIIPKTMCLISDFSLYSKINIVFGKTIVYNKIWYWICLYYPTIILYIPEHKSNTKLGQIFETLVFEISCTGVYYMHINQLICTHGWRI